MEQLTFLSEEHLAKTTLLRETDSAWLESVVNFQGSMSDFLQGCERDGLCGKTSLDVSPRTGGATSARSSRKLPRSGMGFSGEFWTLDISEFPKDASESLLSDILETGDLPQRLYLTEGALAGLRRRIKNAGVVPPSTISAILGL
jgi:hypothetical protein